MQVWDGCSSGTARSQIWDPKMQFLDLDGLSRFQPTVPVTFLHLQTPNSDSHSHSQSLSSNTDDVSPAYDHLNQFCPKIILMTLTIRSLAILPSCSDGGSLFLE